MTAPSPRPAALVTAKALAAAVGIETGGDCQIAESEAEAILRNLSGYGLVLIPRAELEEAAEAAEAMEVHWAEQPLARASWHDLATKLRQRSRG